MMAKRCENSFCSRKGQDIVANIRCEWCRDRSYCSSACRLEDWNMGHERVCESVFKERLAEIEATCPFLNDGVILQAKDTKDMAISIEKALEKYEKVNVEGKSTHILGKGSYGQVLLMRHKQSKKLMAMKVIEKRYVGNATMLKSLTREIEIHKSLLHKNVIRLHEHMEDARHIYLVMDYAAKGSLFQFIRSKGRLSEKESFFFFTETSNAIYFLHKHKLMHRDIKPENLLITHDGTLKLCDFGSCTPCGSEGRRTFCGTTEYMAPEVVKKEGYREKADVWSLGVLLYEMLHGYAPFHGRRDEDTVSKILENKLSFEADIKDDARLLIQSMLASNPHTRPNVIELFASPWVKRLQAEFKIPDRPRLPSADSVGSVGVPIPPASPSALPPHPHSHLHSPSPSPPNLVLAPDQCQCQDQDQGQGQGPAAGTAVGLSESSTRGQARGHYLPHQGSPLPNPSPRLEKYKPQDNPPIDFFAFPVGPPVLVPTESQETKAAGIHDSRTQQASVQKPRANDSKGKSDINSVRNGGMTQAQPEGKLLAEEEKIAHSFPESEKIATLDAGLIKGTHAVADSTLSRAQPQPQPQSQVTLPEDKKVAQNLPLKEITPAPAATTEVMATAKLPGLRVREDGSSEQRENLKTATALESKDHENKLDSVLVTAAHLNCERNQSNDNSSKAVSSDLHIESAAAPSSKLVLNPKTEYSEQVSDPGVLKQVPKLDTRANELAQTSQLIGSESSKDSVRLLAMENKGASVDQLQNVKREDAKNTFTFELAEDESFLINREEGGEGVQTRSPYKQMHGETLNLEELRAGLQKRLLTSAIGDDDETAIDELNHSYDSDDYAYQRSETLLKAVHYLDDLDCGVSPAELESRVRDIERDHRRLTALCGTASPVRKTVRPSHHPEVEEALFLCFPAERAKQSEQEADAEAEAEAEAETETKDRQVQKEPKIDRQPNASTEVPTQLIYDYPGYNRSISSIVTTLVDMKGARPQKKQRGSKVVKARTSKSKANVPMEEAPTAKEKRRSKQSAKPAEITATQPKKSASFWDIAVFILMPNLVLLLG